MRNPFTPAVRALALLTTAPVLAQTAKPPVVPAPAPVPPAAAQTQAAQAADSVKQIQLTPEIIDHYLAAKKDVDTALDAMPEGSDQPDPETLKKLDAITKAHMFADYKDYDATENTIGIVMAGIDPETKAYIGPEAVIDKQIAEVQADKQIAAKDKKDTIDQLKASKATVAKVQYPSNIDVVTKNYDRLNEAMPQD